MQGPNRLDRYQEYYDVGDGIEKTAGVQQGRDIDAGAMHRLHPYLLPGRAFPDLDETGCKVEQSEYCHEAAEDPIQDSATVHDEDSTV